MARNWAVTGTGKLVLAGSSALSRVPGAAPPPTGSGNYSTPPFPPDTNSHPITALDRENFDDHEHLFKTLAPASAHTKFAGISGSWSDGLIWDGGVVPGAGDKVWIPEFEEDGVTPLVVTYDVDNPTAALTWVRVSGELTWSTTDDTTMLVHLLVTDTTGKITMGTRSNPIPQGVTADILFPSTTNMTLAADSRLLGRGFVSHGEYEAFGAEKTSWSKVATNLSQGATSLSLPSAPTNWQIGDVLVISGTNFVGWSLSTLVVPPEDEVVTITNVSGSTVSFTPSLQNAPNIPRSDLRMVVANYTRNITFASQSLHGTYNIEDYFGDYSAGPTIPNHRRGHVMAMHSHSWDARFVAFHELGRTRKGGRDFVRLTPLESPGDGTTNVRGRYPMHFHRTGHGHIAEPGIVYGCAVWGTPGWGFVHHDGNATIQNCVAFNCTGAGYVAETGNEVGQWIDNVSIRTIGEPTRNGGWDSFKVHHVDDDMGRDVVYTTFDLARTGDGFWFQGRAIHVRGCIAITCNHGFAYFHRGRTEDKGDVQPAMLNYDADPAAEEVDVPDMVLFASGSADEIPIRFFKNTEAFACRCGFEIQKNDQAQRHDFYTVLEDTLYWNVVRDAGHFAYTGHYLMLNWDVIGRNGGGHRGISIGNNAIDMVTVNPIIQGFSPALRADRTPTSGFPQDPYDYGYVVVNPTYINVGSTGEALMDDVLTTGQLVPGRMNINLTDSEPLTYTNLGHAKKRGIPIRGTKQDSIGTVELGIGMGSGANPMDSYFRDTKYFHALARHDGYYTSGGTNKGVLPMYFSDRATGRHTKVGFEFNYPNLPSGAVNLGVWNASPGTPTATNQNVNASTLDVTDDNDSSDLSIVLDSGFDSTEQPKHGRIFWSKASNTVTYRPDIGYSGTDSFDFWTRDQQNFTRGAITITVS